MKIYFNDELFFQKKMMCFDYSLYFFIGLSIMIFHLEVNGNIWQIYFDLSNKGLEFSPFDQQTLLFIDNTKSILFCVQKCFTVINCRSFNFDIQTKYCRLYEGDIDNTGFIISSLSSQSVCGSIKLDSNDFLDYGRSCSSCENSRYLTCINSTCQCQYHTYFDGSICRSQKFNGSQCTNDIECRNDMNLTCHSNMQCSCKYYYSIILIYIQTI